MGLFALDVDDEPQPTGIVFELRVVKALLRWRGQTRLGCDISFLHFI
jgi:hypothetical protein